MHWYKCKLWHFPRIIRCVNTGWRQAALIAVLLKSFWKLILDCKVNLSSWYCGKDKHRTQIHAEDYSLKDTRVISLLSSLHSLWQPYCLLPLIASSIRNSVSKSVEIEKTQKKAIRIIGVKKTQPLWNDRSDQGSFSLDR